MSSSLVTTRRSALHQTFLSSSATPSLVRRTLMVWLQEHGVGEDQREDLVLAVSEAVTNVVDHAYRGVKTPGCVEVDIELTHERNHNEDPERWVTVAVTDFGAWRSERACKGFRGRGLQMIQACTDWRHIERRAVGTRVTMALHVG
jgi:anti-sigma regulatory factor (Ser/Thr protein kinase)